MFLLDTYISPLYKCFFKYFDWIICLFIIDLLKFFMEMCLMEMCLLVGIDFYTFPLILWVGTVCITKVFNLMKPIFFYVHFALGVISKKQLPNIWSKMYSHVLYKSGILLCFKSIIQCVCVCLCVTYVCPSITESFVGKSFLFPLKGLVIFVKTQGLKI